LNITIPIRKSSKAEAIPPPSKMINTYVPEKDEIRSLLKKKSSTFKPFKQINENDSFEFLQSVLLEWMNIIAQSKTTSAELKRYIRETRPKVENAYENSSLLRDYFKGVLNEFVTMFEQDETLTTLIERSMSDDIIVRSLFARPDESKRNIDYLRAREREEFKERMRRLPDAQRELRKELIDRGLAPYIITRDDREAFVAQLESQKEIPEIREPPREEQLDTAPEDMNVDRDFGAQGEVPEVNGIELQYDYGDYGDMRADQEGDYGHAFQDEEF